MKLLTTNYWITYPRELSQSYGWMPVSWILLIEIGRIRAGIIIMQTFMEVHLAIHQLSKTLIMDYPSCIIAGQ